MYEDKEQGKVTPETDQDFPQFLKQVRKEENVLLEQLSEGIMTVSQLARIEKGQRPVFKNMRDRLLGRLGIASDLYENLLNIEDYAAWEQQRTILSAIERKDVQKAQELLTVYEKQNPTTIKDKIKQQFCLVMRAEILKQQSASPNEIGECYERAVKLTVPDVEHLCVENKLLSIQEVNMILEYAFYHKDERFTEKCKDIMRFVENSLYDDLSKVKVYPKVAYYYLREVFTTHSKQILEMLDECLTVCNQAIEMLRDTGRAYFLLELLEMKIKILERIENDSGENKEVRSLEELKSACQESTELANLLKKLYDEYEVPAYMQDCTYLYIQRWMFYVGDVLRIRRRMYGFTQKTLCEGICSVRTLRRTEKKEMNMQHEVLGALLRRLGLSKEFQRARLVTNDKEVLKLREEMVDYRNNRQIEKAREILYQMKKRVSSEITENRQYFMELEASLDWMDEKITKEEFAIREGEALRCTLVAKELYNVDEIYLTEMEVLCIRNRMIGVEETEKKKCIELLLRFFEWYEKRSALFDCISMYEFVMVHIASDLGNMKEYQSAINLDRKVLREDLVCRRFWLVDNILYNILWSESEQRMEQGRFFDAKEMTENLKQCILLSHFCKQTFNEKFYYSKLH